MSAEQGELLAKDDSVDHSDNESDDKEFSDQQSETDKSESADDGIDHRKIIDVVKGQHLKDIKLGNLQLILKKLEYKGEKNDILKLKEMRALRAQINVDVQ